ncbi:NACHT and WD repeat domain-containing protein [Nocardia sputorum]|uniref:NACHT and WD repeat domain-containing protein n=1 Tax=Nocardia sputorum TaxID=2984338 RepID=UPI0024921750|nr:hypothetical protein [Nocardia sputorum]
MPTEFNEHLFRGVLAACDVSTHTAQEPWLQAVRGMRSTTARRRSQETAPYRGLEAFQTEDAHLFFGRGRLTEQLYERLGAVRQRGAGSRLLIVVGASGSGKSSLLRAGLMPALHRGGTRTALMVPGNNPAKTLDELGPADVIVIDQFEETWTLCGSEDERRAFLGAITGAAGEGSTYVLGLRADFYPHAARETVLHDALADSVLVGPLSHAALREAIVEPARNTGWTIEDELVQLLMVELAPRGSAAAHDAGALPLLSHTLLQTWQHATRRRMTVADYNAVGGIAGAVERTAEAIYTELDGHRQHITRRTFLRLLAIDEDTLTRRRVHRSELTFGDDEDTDVDSVIDLFAVQRLLTTEKDAVEISHEALIRAWARLRDWVDTDRTGLLIHRQLTHAASIWRDGKRDPSALLGANRLSLIRDWAETADHKQDLNQLERDYIAASIAHHEAIRLRERLRTRRLQSLVGGFAITSVVALVLAVAAFAFKTSADQNRVAAGHTRDEAMSRQIALQAASLQSKDPALSAQVALAGYQLSDTLEARSALLDSSAVHTPIRLVGPQGRTLSAVDGTGTLLAVGHHDGSVELHRLGPAGVDAHLGIVPSAAADVDIGVTALALDSSGRTLAVAKGGLVELWTVTDSDAPQRLSAVPSTGTVHSLAFSPNSGVLVAGTADTKILRWEVTKPRLPAVLPPFDFPAGAPVVAFSPDGRLLAAAGEAASLRIWEQNSAHPHPVVDMPADGSMARALAMRFSPDGTVLAIANRANEVRRWRLGNDARPIALPPLGGFTSYVNDVDFSADGALVAAGSSDGTTRIWRAGQVTPEVTLPNPVVVTSMRFAGDGHTIVTSGDDGITRLWPLPGPILRSARSVVYQTVVDRGGTRLLVGAGARDSHGHLWDLRNAITPSEFPELTVGPGDETCGATALSADGRRAALGTRSGRIYLWDITDPWNPTTAQPIPAVNGILDSLAFSPDGTTLIAAAQDNPTVTLWDVADTHAPRQLSSVNVSPGFAEQVAVDRTNALLAIGTSNGVVRFWDIRDRTHPKELPPLGGFRNRVMTLAFSPTSDLLVAGSADHTARIFDLSTPDHAQQVAVLDGPADAVVTVSFSPDGNRIVGGGGANGIWIWDITHPAEPRRLATLNAYPGRVNDTQYGLNGQILVAAGPDRTVRIWQTDPARIAAQLCSSGSTPLTEDEWRRYLPGAEPHDLCAGADARR